MKTPLCEMFGIDLPIFAFSHCRDVVAGVSKAGGLGVLGISAFTPDQLKAELRWIDEHVGDRPYGVDLLIPERRIEEGDIQKLQAMIPEGHRQYLKALLEEAKVPELPGEYESTHGTMEDSAWIGDRPWKLLAIALEHPNVKLYVNALGTPPKDILENCHAHGVRVAAMAGKVKHAVKHKNAGCDFVIAVGYEAGGHTGDISTMVLTPQVVDAVAPMPVLAAGGIADGRQIAAAMCLGAQGVWTGSVWLATKESELFPAMREKVIASSSDGTVRTKCVTGKPVRMLRSRFTDLWDSESAPKTLPMPLQSLLIDNAVRRFEKFEVDDMMTYPMGQVIGQLNQETSVKQVVYQMMEEYLACVGNLAAGLEEL
jgi:NAD(P)H-dependent flavin oxidoreductase YrpB (nitropropane dioxygenase family)